MPVCFKEEYFFYRGTVRRKFYHHQVNKNFKTECRQRIWRQRNVTDTWIEIGLKKKKHKPQ